MYELYKIKGIGIEIEEPGY